MFSADHFIHFVFDFYNETHYTDTLLALSPEAYVWYELKKQHIDNALFVSDDGSGFRLGAYDSDSAAVLKTEKKKLWGKAQADTEQKVRRVTYTPQELGEDAQSLLGWLLERQESQKNKRTALVFTLDAFTALFQSARDKDRQKLVRLCSRPAGRDLLLIRVPMNAREMGKAFLNPQSPLQQLCPGIRQAAAGPREPLMDALDRQLDRQIFHAYRLTEGDMRGILLRHALVKGDWTDSVRDLEDQAACLYGRSLSRDTCATRREVYEGLQKEGAQEELRSRAAQLRKDYPRLSVADAMLVEAVDMRGPSPLEYKTELAKNVRTLILPEEFLLKYPQWKAEMETIREDFRTVWNKPLNHAACQFAGDFCTEVRSAAKHKDWATLQDALQMLRFCGGELCGETAHEEGLTAICEEGKTVINMSYNLFLQDQAQEIFGSTKPAEGLFARKIDMMNETQRKIAQAKYESDSAQLQMMRSTLNAAMADFKKRHVSQDVMAQFLKVAEKQWSDRLDDVNHVASIMDKPVKETEHEADFEFEAIEFDDSEEKKTPPPKPQQTQKAYTSDDKEVDKQAAEDLFERVFF